MESCFHVENGARKGGGIVAKQRKKRRKSGGIVLVVVLLLIGVVGYELINVYGQLNAARAEEQALSAQVQEKQEANAALQSDLDHADDPEFIAQLARELLGLAEPGERIFYDVNN